MPQDSLKRLWRTLPLLLGEYVVALAAVSAITATVDEPAYEMLIYVAVTVGMLVSLWGVVTERLQVWPGAIVMVLAFTYYALRHYNLPLFGLLYPPEIAGNDDSALAGMVAWLLVAFTFWQSHRSNLIFLAVSGLAVCGLMATQNLNLDMRVIFSVYIVATLFCWGYEQFLEMDDRLAANGQQRLQNWPEMVRGHLSVAVLAGLLTLAVGSAVGTGAYKLSPNLYERMAHRVYGQHRFAERLQSLYNSFAGQFEVGTGSIHLSPIPVLKIKATRGSLWRGMVYDTYDGKSWTRRMGGGYRVEVTGGQYAVPQYYLSGMRRWTTNRQDVEVLGYPGRIIAAAQPATVDLHMRGEYLSHLMAPTVDAYGCVSGPENDVSRQYSVVSHEPLTDPSTLRGAPADYPRGVWDAYTGVTADAGEALSGLSKEITAGAQTPYDKVMALQQYLEKHCLYTLSPPAVPRGKDAAAYFVLDSRRGACDLFATSLAVMTRLSGIPARVATGYATGEYDADEQAFTVRGTDAHAWVEVYFPTVGWVAFDPQAAERYEEQSWTELLTEGHWDLALKQTARQVGWVVLLGLIAFLAITALVDPVQALQGVLPSRSRTPLERLSREYEGFYQMLLRRLKVRPDPWLTPREAIESINGKLTVRSRLDPRRLMAFNERFYQLRYDVRPRWSEVEELRKELREMRRGLKQRR